MIFETFSLIDYHQFFFEKVSFRTISVHLKLCSWKILDFERPPQILYLKIPIYWQGTPFFSHKLRRHNIFDIPTQNMFGPDPTPLLGRFSGPDRFWVTISRFSFFLFQNYHDIYSGKIKLLSLPPYLGNMRPKISEYRFFGADIANLILIFIFNMTF